MKTIITLVGLCFFYFSAAAQISTDEPPISSNPQIKLLMKDKSISFDIRDMPRIDLAKIREEDESERALGVPPRFGYPIDVDLNLHNSGTWTDLPNGDKIWQLGIRSKDALSLNLLYDKFWLPEGAKFFVYSEDRKHSIGAMTSVNNKGEIGNVQGFATGLIYGESIVLEYYLPKGVEDKGIISIAAVVHGYRYINLNEFTTQDLGDSGNCEVNVNCSEGSNWQQEKNAVALILVGGTRMCTGSLINTTCNDNRPTFLTANHCLLGADAINSPNLNNWSFYWHYESPTCSDPSQEPPLLSTSGATIAANNGNADFALLNLTEDPRNKNGVTPYYLGWDRSGNAGTGGVGIHHPSGDIKKISTFTSAPTSTNYLSNTANPSGNYWRIIWAATVTNHGVTEGGSSGSSLINNNRRVIGQLQGGLASCNLLNSPDWYGKFSVSWTGGGATDNRRRLSDWLNPGTGTAPMTLDGKSVTRIIGPDNGACGANYSVQNIPTGGTVTWTFSSNLQRINPPGASSLMVVPVNPNFSSGGWVQASISAPGVCSFIRRKDIWVGVPGLPDPAFQSFNIYNGGTFNAPSFPGKITGYIWTVSSSLTVVSGGGTSDSTITVSINSNQIVGDIFVKAMNSCGGSVQPAQIRVNRIQSFNFLVYPNPVAEDLYVEVTGNDSTQLIEESLDYEIKLFDENGNEFISKRSKERKNQISLRNLGEGIYYVHILYNEELIRKKILIRR